MSDQRPGTAVNVYEGSIRVPIEEGHTTSSMMYDDVTKPSHYCEGRRYEPRKVIYDWSLDFNLGNVIKYIARAGRKEDILKDLKKARQYLDFEIEEMEGGQ